MVLSIKDIALVLWRKKIPIVLSAILGCILLTFLGSHIEKPQYTAKASMYVYNSGNRMSYNISAGELTASQKLVSTYIVVLESDNVLNQVCDELEDYDLTATEIRKMLSASSIDDTEAFRIAVTAEDPKMAQEVCNTILKVAPDEIVRVVKAGSVEIIDWAQLPETSTWNIKKYIMMGGALGFALSFCYYLLRFLFDTTIYDEDILMDNFDMPVIGSIPMEITKIDRYDQNSNVSKRELDGAEEKE